MRFIAWTFALGVGFDLLLHLKWARPARKLLAVCAIIATGFATGAFVIWQVNVGGVLIAVISLYRVLNDLRIIEERMHERYLQRATLRSSLVLIALQAAVGIGLWAWQPIGQLLWLAVSGLQLLGAVVVVVSTARRLRHTRWPLKAPAISDTELPTVSVAIPARNETEDLQACLDSLVASNYPKLEILVLDDCSQTKRTPEIIRQYAHDGVRFIQGEEPRPTWLAKNQAYHHLSQQANGEYIVFCGVDVRFGRDSLRQVMSIMLARHKSMMSILPWRAPAAERRFAVTQAMRYAWELVPPRRLFRRPPVLSTCWVIKKQTLKDAGGFLAATRAIVPEAYFARTLVKTDAYSFMRANQELDIESTKPAREQRDTAIRMRYPQMHKRPENVLLLTIVYGFFTLLPFGLLVSGFWIAIGPVAHILTIVTVLLLVITYEQVAIATRTGSRWFGLVALPFGVLYDVMLLHVSMWQYEFSVIDWKGRNICVPAMHVVPHLPKV